MTTLEKSLWRLPMLSGMLLVFAYFPFGLLIPNLVAFLPMLYWIDANPEASVGRRLRAGLIFGLTVNLVILHWMYAMLAVSWLAIALYLFLVSVFALGAMVALALAAWIRHRTGWSFALVLPACWLPVEWARTWSDLRINADHLGHTLAGYPFLIQFADLVGPYGVGAFMLLTNGLLYEIVRRRKRGGAGRPALALASMLVAVLAYDGWAWTRPPRSEGAMRVAFVQPNIPLEVKDSIDTADQQWEILARLTREAAKQRPDLVVWPESAYPRPLFHLLDHPGTYQLPDLQLLARETHTTILTGVEYYRVRRREDYDMYNAAVVVHPDGRLDPTWTAKVYLVPFTEGVPFKSILGPLLSDREGELQWLGGGFEPGPAVTSLPVEDHPVGVVVCYEDFFPDLERTLRNAGAQLLVVITNDAWFGRTVFQAYQANALRLRAIENRTAFVRAANTGISGFVDPRGRYHERTGLFVEAVEVRDLPLTSTRTVYDRAGDVVAWIAIAGLVVMAVAATFGVRRAKVRAAPGLPTGDAVRGEGETGS